MIENIVVTLDSLEYPTDFMIISPKVNLFGYLVILGRPWLAIADANINYRLRNMTISNGQATKRFDLYPLAQPLLDLSTSVWPDLGDEEEELNSIVKLSASCRIVGVALNPSILSFFIVSLVMTFIAAPRSIKAFLID